MKMKKMRNILKCERVNDKMYTHREIHKLIKRHNTQLAWTKLKYEMKTNKI